VDMAFDAEKKSLAVLNSSSVMLMDGSTGVPVDEVKSRTTSYAGIAFRPGGRELWASETTRRGPDSMLVCRRSATGRIEGHDRLEFPGHPVPAGIAFSGDGKTAYVALSRNNSLAIIDAETKKLVREVPVGLAPFAVAVHPKTGSVFVINRAGARPSQPQSLAPSSGTQVPTDPQTGSVLEGTVTVLDPETLTAREVKVGRAPAALALSPDAKTLMVANGHSDSLSAIDTSTLAITTVSVPTSPAGLLGSQPVALAFSGNGKRLYVGCAGDNSIAVLEGSGRSWKTAGALPVGWFPSALAVDAQGDLRVLNIKGIGNTARAAGSFNSRAYEGSLSKIPAPAGPQLAAGTREVRASNNPRFEPAGGVANLDALGIKHVFLIVKENRTYDQVFGDLDKGNRDPKLVMYGREITPNHHALAEQFVLLDNFYATGAISFEGHQWLMQGFVSDYVERALMSAPRGYAWNMSDALTVSPAGFFWQNARRPLDVRIYGTLALPALWDAKTQNAVDINEDDLLSWTAYWEMYKKRSWTGSVGSRAAVPALDPLLVKYYPVNSMRVPDQIRAEVFLEELAKFEKQGRAPDLLIVGMTSDHTMGTNPGAPTPAAMVADNDLALGRMVEGVTKSRFWPESLILVVEDDAQDGLDHVDGHRTVALAIGPNIRRGHLDSSFYTQLSMVRTIQDIFRIPPRTRFLSTSRAMNAAFTADKDVRPYRAITPSIALDTMNPPLKALRGKQLLAARQSSRMNWDEVDDVPSAELNRILWWDRKGYDTPYPRVR
jgi:YVTN family beta-propeller protein